MPIEIENNIFEIENEELDDIEYLEILTLDEIIKDNPYFIALSRNDIYENLFEMFQNKKRSQSVTQLFYDILEYSNNKEGKLSNYDNYIFNTDAEKKENILLYDEKKDDALKFNKLSKLNTLQSEEAKNKYFFSIKYDASSKNLKFKPTAKINALIQPENKEYPVYYPVYPVDNVNLPILAAYYKIPTCTINDYIYNKIASHLFNSKNINTEVKNKNSLTSKNNVFKNIDTIFFALFDYTLPSVINSVVFIMMIIPSIIRTPFIIEF